MFCECDLLLKFGDSHIRKDLFRVKVLLLLLFCFLTAENFQFRIAFCQIDLQDFYISHDQPCAQGNIFQKLIPHFRIQKFEIIIDQKVAIF
jgi:hypothetical protein